MGKEFEKERGIYKHIAFCTSETNTTLLTNYTPI